jgi:Fic family protein
MQLSIERAANLQGLQPKDLLDIHRVLLERAPNSQIAGRFRTSQNWIGGNDYNPCGAALVPPPPENVDELLDDLCAFVNDDDLPPLI